MRAPTLRPASEGLVDSSNRARTVSPSTVNSGVVTDLITLYWSPRLRLRRRCSPENPVLRPTSTRVQPGANGTSSARWLASALM